MVYGGENPGGPGKIHHRTSIYSMINIRRHGVRVHWLCVVCVGLLVVDKATIHCDVVQQCPEVRSQNRFRELHRLLCALGDVGKGRGREKSQMLSHCVCIHRRGCEVLGRCLVWCMCMCLTEARGRASEEERGLCEVGYRVANPPCASVVAHGDDMWRSRNTSCRMNVE